MLNKITNFALIIYFNHFYMGLDIYICRAKKEGLTEMQTKRTEIFNKISDLRIRKRTCKSNEKQSIDEQISELFIDYDNCNPYSVIAEFRKANFLMNFFEYEGNCELKEISRDEVTLLLENCVKVLNDHNKASELLPTQEGYFFGSTEYDEAYFNKVQDVLAKMSNILNETNWDDNVLYIEAWY